MQKPEQAVGWHGKLNNSSQLAGFAKKDDLEYFLKKICRMEYVHLPELAPTPEMLDAYRKEHKDWETYARQFVALSASHRQEGDKEDALQRLPAMQ